MAGIDPLELTTRREKVVTAAIALVSVLVHLAILLSGLIHLTPEPKKPERRLMTVHRVPPPKPPAPVDRQVFQRKEAVVATEGKAPKPDGPRRPDERTDRSAESQAKAPEPETDDAVPEDKTPRKQNTVSVMTDIAEAFFRLEGPVAVKGAGIFWEKSGLPPGAYRVTFGTVEGFETPPPQSGTLAEGGELSFVGRYTKMTQVVVGVNVGQARFKIIRPDGQYLDLKGNTQGLFKDLPVGTYTIVYEDVPGFITPGAQSRKLGAGGHLTFSGAYVASGGDGEGAGQGSGGTGLGARGEKKRPAREAESAALDRRVRMVVTAYFRSNPNTGVERQYGPMAYPERIIRRENYQEGWSQVYLVISTDDDGQVRDVLVQRPREDEREAFRPLIEAVEKAVRSWEYEPEAAEVHADIRFFVERK